MFCRNCGKEIDENAIVCIHCGCAVEKKPVSESKHTMGLLLGIFVGLIGLIIGVCVFPTGSYERETFMKGWTKGFVITLIIGLVFGVIYGCAIASLVGSMGY